MYGVCVSVCVNAVGCVYKSKDSLWMLACSVLHVSPGYWAQVTRLVGKCLNPAGHLSGLGFVFQVPDSRVLIPWMSLLPGCWPSWSPKSRIFLCCRYLTLLAHKAPVFKWASCDSGVGFHASHALLFTSLRLGAWSLSEKKKKRRT